MMRFDAVSASRFNSQYELKLGRAMVMGGLALGVNACSDSDEPTSAEIEASFMGKCENNLESDRPCPGLLAACSTIPHVDPTFVTIIAISDCVGEHFRETGTITFVRPIPDVPGFELTLSSGCSVSVDVDVDRSYLPAWPWLVEGQPLDVELWHAGGLARSGSPLWLILRAPDTGEFSFTIHQLGWQLLEADMPPELLGFDVNIEAPVCEYYDIYCGGGDLTHAYSLSFHGEQSSVVASAQQRATITLRGGQQVRVQTMRAAIGYNHLAPAGCTESHPNYGRDATFAAWPEP